MIRKNPMKDVDNPPGQARYLRDVIKKYQDEEDRYPDRHGTINKVQATTPLDNAEKRLERLKTALLSMCGDAEKQAGMIRAATVYTKDIRKLLKENT